jgi:hypothetical protein
VHDLHQNAAQSSETQSNESENGGGSQSINLSSPSPRDQLPEHYREAVFVFLEIYLSDKELSAHIRILGKILFQGNYFVIFFLNTRQPKKFYDDIRLDEKISRHLSCSVLPISLVLNCIALSFVAN